MVSDGSVGGFGSLEQYEEGENENFFFKKKAYKLNSIYVGYNSAIFIGFLKML